MIDGLKIKVGNEEFTVPPLTLGALRRLTPKVKILVTLATDELPDEEQLGALTDLALAALKRNYPDMTAERVEEIIDLGNLPVILPAILSAAGLEKRSSRPGEAERP